MKKINKNAYLLSLLGTLLLSACGKEEEAAQPAAESESSDPVAAVAAKLEDVAAGAKEMAEPAKEAMQSVKAEMQEVKEAVTTSLNDGDKDVMQVVESVKKLIGEAKYSEALAAISELSIDQLSPELQKVAQGLKEQAEKALSSAAAGKAGETIDKVLKENNIPIENPFKK